MASPVVEATGTTLADGTEQTLSTINTPRNLTLSLDASVLSTGDAIRLRAYKKVLSGGALVLFYEEIFGGAQSVPGLISTPLPSPHQAAFTLEQLSGTYRSFPWSVESM